MKIKLTAGILLAVLSAGCADQTADIPPPVAADVVEQSPYSKPLSRSETQYVEVSAKVTAVNYKKRDLTVVGPSGQKETFKVDPAVKRLKEIKKGDLVTLQYVRSIAIEVREPTAKEKKEPSKLVVAAGRAEPSESPAGAVGSTVKTIVKVTGIDRYAETITVKGPKGNSLTVQAKDPKNLERIKIGDSIAVTYTEAVAVSVEPLKK